MSRLPSALEQKLIDLGTALIDQENAREIIAPKMRASGFWFGGGNAVPDASGNLYVCGRFRNHGDSRHGIAAGERGVELAVFASEDGGETFEHCGLEPAAPSYLFPRKKKASPIPTVWSPITNRARACGQ